MKIQASLALTLTVLISGCGGSGSSTGTLTDACTELASDSFSCETMLNDLIEFGVQPVSTQLVMDATTLHSATDAYCDPLISSDTDDAANLIAAKDAWQEVANGIEQLALMQFGPLADADTGMKSLYFWPEVTSCNVDRQVVDGSLGSSSKSGLFAMEYLLFGSNGTVSCSSTDSPAVTSWASGLSQIEIKKAQCSYAKLVADDVLAQSTRLDGEWANYSLRSGASTLQAAAGKVTDALFYIDKQTKDVKIKAALPQPDIATSQFDDTKLESQFAHASKEAILNNLLAVKTMLTLNDTDNSKTGLDDYLIAADQAGVAQAMLTALNSAIDNVNAINGSGGGDGTVFTAVSNATNETVCKDLATSGVYVTSSSDIDTFCALQHNVKQFTDILKGDFTFLTSFTVPASADGDND
jgi:predicted lipoprotein